MNLTRLLDGLRAQTEYQEALAALAPTAAATWGNGTPRKSATLPASIRPLIGL